MPKTMCEWKREDFEEKFDKLAAIVTKPAFVCMKCGRVADDKDRLCKPKALNPKGS